MGNRRIVTPSTKRRAELPAEQAAAAPPTPQPTSEPVEADRRNEPRPSETFGSEFLDNVAHQMVAPLQSIAMHCRNILEGLIPSDKQPSRLKEVIGHAEILAELARRMRFLHELVSGKHVGVERLSFEDLTSVWINCYNNYLAVHSKMTADIDYPTMNSLPDVTASRLAVHQVLMNLYDNASKYGKRPDARVRVSAKVQGEFIVNEFSHDAGVLLTERDASQMFNNRGYRSEAARQLRASGTGTGMWISAELMRAMGGTIRAIPTNKEGRTRFQIKWKMAR